MKWQAQLPAWILLATILAYPGTAFCEPSDLGGMQPEKWAFLDGAEFPGAQGKLAAGQDDRDSASLLIEGDFSQGGNFVGAARTFPSPMEITSLTVRVYTTTGILGLRINDSSGQCFQQSVKLPANTWQEITLTEFGNPKRRDIHHWGGSRDGVFRQPAKALAFLLFKPTDETTKIGEVRIAGIQASVVPPKPPVRPATITPANLTQFWLTPNQPTTLKWRYVPGTDAKMPTDLPFTLRDYVGATIRAQTSAVASDGGTTVTVALPVGYYEVEIAGQCFGLVSQPPAEVDRSDDFFAIDAAMSSLASFGREDARAQLISNLARTGIAMVRERTDWKRMNPTSGVWVASTRGDRVRRQLQAGRVAALECFQDAPAWTGSSAGDPYPRDLIGTRDAWIQLARRWGGSWGAVEVWNEPNLSPYPADWWSSMQKAVAYGMREALPNVPCGGGALSTFDQSFTSQLAKNRALDAMDFVSFHTYSPAPGIESMVANYRDWLTAAGHVGMPLWLTEVGHPWARGTARPPVAQDQACALDMTMQVVEARACGVKRVFPFIYGYYDENQNNFGMMGRENTPLRSLAGYANLVRILGRQSYIGDLADVAGVIRARVFGRGDDAQVVVALYAGETKPDTTLAANLQATHLEGVDGRRLSMTADGRIPIPDGLVYVWVPRSAVAPRLKTDTEAVRLSRLSQQQHPQKSLSPLVLRCMADPQHMRVSARGYDVPDPFDGRYTARVRLSNLDSHPCQARVVASLAGVDAVLRQETVEVPANGFTDLAWTLDLSLSPLTSEGVTDLQIEATPAQGSGDRLTMHLMRSVGIDVMLARRSLRLDTPVREVQRWRVNVIGGGTMALSPLAEGGLHADVDFGSATGASFWAYPQFFGLPPATAMHGVKGVIVRGRVDGGGTVRMFAVEKEGGGKYIYASPIFPADGQWHNAYVPFQDFSPFASVDPNGRLDPEQLAHIEIGCNTRTRQCTIEINQLWFVGDEASGEQK